MTILSQSNIDAAEKAIMSDMLVTDGSVPSISMEYYENAENEWRNIQDDTMFSYRLFASNAYGMQSYGFYKANDGKIYIIDAWMNEIRRIYIPSDKIDCLKNLIK